MPRWTWIVLLLAVGAYGWRQAAAERARGPNEIIAVNHTGRDLEQLTITVGGRRTGVASLGSGASARLTVRCDRDDRFRLAWRTREPDRERTWEGGRFTHGPLPMRHRFELIRGGGVVWRSEPIAARPAR